MGSASFKRMARRLRNLHGGLLLLTAVLCFLGLMMQFSAAGGDPTVFAIPQATKIVLGTVLMVGFAGISTQQLFRVTYIVYGLFLALLLAVDIVGMLHLGAQRWVSVGGTNLQPSELMKIGIILVLARYFQSIKVTKEAKHYMLLIVPGALTLVPVALILKQPNLGTATIVSVIAFAMCFMAGIRWWYFAGAIGGAAAAVPVAYHMLHDYQKQRVMTFLDPGSDPLGAGYNIIQSKIAYRVRWILRQRLIEWLAVAARFPAREADGFHFHHDGRRAWLPRCPASVGAIRLADRVRHAPRRSRPQHLLPPDRRWRRRHDVHPHLHQYGDGDGHDPRGGRAPPIPFLWWLIYARYLNGMRPAATCLHQPRPKRPTPELSLAD